MDNTTTAKTGDTVSVHYRGTLEDGTEFDSSYEREPLTFTLGEGTLLKGFEAAIDGMTADFYDFNHDFLRTVSTNIINKVKGVNRVVYDITSKPPGTIEWE